MAASAFDANDGARIRRAPLQNRVDPFGALHSTPARGALMGNRGGRFHSADQQLGARRWISRRWITCLCDFRGRRRAVWGAGLFFLDEATALAAGHRPCGECRRTAYRAFKTCWAEGASHAAAALPVAEMDRVLHADRVEARRQRTHRDRLDALPDGAMVARDDEAWLKWDGALLAWSLGGYARRVPVTGDLECTVLTPRSTVAALRAGYRPAVHDSAATAPS